MTRDEAIKMVFGVLLSNPIGSSASHAMMTDHAMNLVDSLAALGVLKIDAPNRRDANAETERVMSGLGLAFCPSCGIIGGAHIPGCPEQQRQRCAPPPEHQDKEWHWLKQIKSRSVQPIVCRWLEVSWYFCGEVVTADDGYDSGWRYIAPCEPPSTVTDSVIVPDPADDYGLPRTA